MCAIMPTKRPAATAPPDPTANKRFARPPSAGSNLINPEMTTCVSSTYQKKLKGLAPAASSLRKTAAAAATPAASAASAASARELHADLRCSGVFLVEDIKGRQADVGNFLLAKRNHGTRCDVLRGNIWHRRSC